MSTKSFADQMPSLLNSKSGQSDYSYFDATKLKLFAGPNIWKFTNLLSTSTPTTTTNNNTSIVREHQAPVTPHKIAGLPRELGGGPKRHIRIDTFNTASLDEIMSGKDRKGVGTSQSSLLLRMREKSLNQMQLARKTRPLSDLMNSHNFPDLNFSYLDLLNHRRERQQEQIGQYYDQEDFHDGHDHLDDDSKIISHPTIEFIFDF